MFWSLFCTFYGIQLSVKSEWCTELVHNLLFTPIFHKKGRPKMERLGVRFKAALLAINKLFGLFKAEAESDRTIPRVRKIVRTHNHPASFSPVIFALCGIHALFFCFASQFLLSAFLCHVFTFLPVLPIGQHIIY